MQPRDGLDPCELVLSNYAEMGGRDLPTRWQVRYGDRPPLEFSVEQWQFDEKAPGALN